ncbi:hypothetical protein [Pseudomonas fluorescens]|nr:hypothetical protein [Pseudomonas fluorescens]
MKLAEVQFIALLLCALEKAWQDCIAVFHDLQGFAKYISVSPINYYLPFLYFASIALG